MSKLIELPSVLVYKTDEGKKKTEINCDCAIQLEPPLEISPHPTENGITFVRTVFGIKTVRLPYAEVLEKFKNAEGK